MLIAASLLLFAFGAQAESLASWRGPRHVAPYLHEIWYEDYDFKADSNSYFGEMATSCSSVRKGNFHGRNLDYCLWDTPEFVVHVAAKPSVGRLASIGVAHPTTLRESGVLAGIYSESYKTLPIRTQDGINECGVVVNCNVVPRFDCGALPKDNPHPGHESSMHILAVSRYILDHATNAAHAVELVKAREGYFFGTCGDDCLTHYMVSDPKETVVIEFIQGKVVARHQEIMTNFNLNWDNVAGKAVDDSAGWGRDHFWSIGKFQRGTTDPSSLGTLYTPYAMGIERYGELLAGYDGCGPTLDDMMALMRTVQYSKMYEREHEPFWYSEWSELAECLSNECFYATDWSWDDGSERSDWLVDGIELAQAELADPEAARTNGTHSSDTWITIHSSTYDIERRMFRIIVQEDYTHTYDFWLVPPLGSLGNPWKVGKEGREKEVVAYTNGVGGVVIGGAGEVAAMPWTEFASDITEVVKGRDVKGLKDILAPLANLAYVNGLSLEDFNSTAVGVAKAAGFSAIAVDPATQTAELRVVVSRSGSLEEPVVWTPVSTNVIPVKAESPAGFFAVAPAAR